jgi:hypothetical protein
LDAVGRILWEEFLAGGLQIRYLGNQYIRRE